VVFSSLSRIPFLKRAGLVLLAGVLAGCANGTQVISYNRQNRENGMQLYGKGAWAEAASTFNAAIREEPGDYTSRFYLGACEEQMGKLQQAIQQYRTTLDVMDHSLEGKGDFKFRRKVTNQLALSIAHEGDRSGDLTALEQKQPRSAETAFMLARIYRQTGDADSALSRFQQAQQLDPRDSDIAKEYGLYLEQLGQTQRADTQLRRAYALNSRDEEVSAALRRLGVIPGPSLKGEDGLEKPLVPLGPLPELDVTTSNKGAQTSTPITGGQSTPPAAVGSTGSPRD
jgi:tetratricopeptide (TPR) repeat protein